MRGRVIVWKIWQMWSTRRGHEPSVVLFALYPCCLRGALFALYPCCVRGEFLFLHLLLTILVLAYIPVPAMRTRFHRLNPGVWVIRVLHACLCLVLKYACAKSLVRFANEVGQDEQDDAGVCEFFSGCD
jgi:hypothetical protein